MAKMKLKQLRDADVRYISLVDRAATRIPFRVLKRDKESKMGIDLTKVFKSDRAEKPFVSAVVVFAQKSDDAKTQVWKAIAGHGFRTDRVQKSDEGETLVFAQADAPENTQIVRLSDQSLISAAGLPPITGWMGELIKEHGFVPDLSMAKDLLYAELAEVAKSETPIEEGQAVLDSYGEYLNTMFLLPSACYKLDEAIQEIAQKCSCETAKQDEAADEAEDKKDKGKDEAAEGEADEKKKAAKSEADKKRVKEHAASGAEMAPADEEDDQKPPPDEAYKAEILSTLKSLGQKLETVVTEQAEQKKVLDEVVQKSDTLSQTLRTTVMTPPNEVERPQAPRMRIQKQDTDPRTGYFDTAFIARSQRRNR